MQLCYDLSVIANKHVCKYFSVIINNKLNFKAFINYVKSKIAKSVGILSIKSNQIFHYTRCNTPERVTSWRGPSPRHLRPGNTAPFEEMSQRWRAVGNTMSDLTGPRFEHQTSRSKDKRVTVRPTGRSYTK